MRCQRVRSCLSAYCKDELTGREVLAVREHLSICPACRKEEVLVRNMEAAAHELPKTALSGDFNTRLLNRIAQERFAETRTKAYLPQRAPRFAWRTLAPALTSALVIAVVAIGFMTSPQQSNDTATGLAQSDDYRTVQPINNPNMLHKNWSLRGQLAQTERLGRISGMLTASSNFTNVASQSPHGWAGQNPYFQELLRMRPVIRVYQPANSTQVSEVRNIY